MKIKKIAEGAYFVPTYYAPIIETRVPGLVIQSNNATEIKPECEELNQQETDNKEEIENISKEIKPNF